MGTFQDLTGQTFNRLTVVGLAGARSGSRRKPMWNCLCVCGQRVIVIGDNLRSRCTKSCGCLDRDVMATRSLTHGESRGGRTPEYQTWKQIKQRCLNPNNPKFKDYGARGITVCSEWRADYTRFLRDMGRRPKGCSIERLNNDGDYSPGNCVWAMPQQQSHNKRSTLRLTFNGETNTLTEWAIATGIPAKLLYTRIRHNWPTESILTEPKRQGVPLRHRPTPSELASGTRTLLP